jgi:Mor family transcriptional regulator
MASPKGVSTQQRSKDIAGLLAEAIALYEDHSLPVTEIQKKLGLSQTALYRLLRRGGFKPNAPRSGGGQRVFTVEQDKQVAEEYRQGMSMEQLAAKYNVWRRSVKNALRREGVTLRRPGPVKHAVDPAFAAQLLVDWHAGMTQYAIAKKHGMTEAKVWGILKDSFPNALAKASRRRRHYAWQGGRRNHMGYVMVLLEPGHRFYAMATADGYVLEHRLVMAEFLGRLLNSKETIHHIDGNRSNNIISNLQLRQGQHGNGVIYHCADCGSFNVVAQAIAAPANDALSLTSTDVQGLTQEPERVPPFVPPQLTLAL